MTKIIDFKTLKQNDLVEDEMITWDEFDDAIVGVGTRCGMDNVLVYSKKEMAYKLRDDGMSLEEAIEYIEFNIQGAYVGVRTPIILEDLI